MSNQLEGGVVVVVFAGAVVAAGGAWVGVAGGVLDVLEGCAGGEGFGDEGVPKAVRGDRRGGRNARLSWLAVGRFGRR